MQLAGTPLSEVLRSFRSIPHLQRHRRRSHRAPLATPLEIDRLRKLLLRFRVCGLRLVHRAQRATWATPSPKEHVGRRGLSLRAVQEEETSILAIRVALVLSLQPRGSCAWTATQLGSCLRSIFSSLGRLVRRDLAGNAELVMAWTCMPKQIEVIGGQPALLVAARCSETSRQ